jgi:hypothetical protein
MKRETAQALVASIFHWVELSKAENAPRKGDITSSSCPLCALYAGDACICSNSIYGMCPVFVSTGGKECSNSPWRDAAESRSDWEIGRTAKEGFQKCALRMVEFLQSLLPRNLADNLEGGMYDEEDTSGSSHRKLQ